MLLKNSQIFRTVPLTDVKFLPNFKPRHCFENKSANLKKNLWLYFCFILIINRLVQMKTMLLMGLMRLPFNLIAFQTRGQIFCSTGHLVSKTSEHFLSNCSSAEHKLLHISIDKKFLIRIARGYSYIEKWH